MIKALLAMVLATSPVATVTQMSLPPPTGPAKVGTVTLHLVDRSRPEPWVAGVPHRELMVQLWYPARTVRGHPRADWVSPGVAARINPPDSGFTLPVTHGHVGAPPAPGRHPVVLYSPGFALERTANTALVEELASHGYVVVTIDHTYEAQYVEFPDGRMATHAIPQAETPEEAERLFDRVMDVRAADTRFVLDSLRRTPLARNVDLARVGMFGVSLGGATAAETMRRDRRITAGLNLDGTFMGRVLSTGLNRPFLLMGSDPGEDGQDDTWIQMWDRLRGPRYWVQLDGSRHLSFTDFQVLLPQAGVPPEDYEPVIGSIDGRRSVAVQRAYVRAFFDRHLWHSGGRLLDGPSGRYPEMRFLP